MFCQIVRCWHNTTARDTPRWVGVGVGVGGGGGGGGSADNPISEDNWPTGIPIIGRNMVAENRLSHINHDYYGFHMTKKTVSR